MANKSQINWTLQGKKVKPTTLKVELIESYEHELLRTTGVIVEELDKLVENLDRRSTNRGVGFYAVRYNHPLAGLFAEVKKIAKGYKVFVPVNGKGSPGYKFNLLDQGRPPVSRVNLMKFPSYSGTLSKSAGDTSVVNRARVTSPSPTAEHGDWIATHQVAEITPRKFFEAILKKRQFKNPKATTSAKIKLKPPKFQWEPGIVDVKITRNGK